MRVNDYEISTIAKEKEVSLPVKRRERLEVDTTYEYCIALHHITFSIWFMLHLNVDPDPVNYDDEMIGDRGRDLLTLLLRWSGRRATTRPGIRFDRARVRDPAISVDGRITWFIVYGVV